MIMSGRREDGRARARLQGHSDNVYLSTEQGREEPANKEGVKIFSPP